MTAALPHPSHDSTTEVCARCGVLLDGSIDSLVECAGDLPTPLLRHVWLTAKDVEALTKKEEVTP